SATIIPSNFTTTFFYSLLNSRIETLFTLKRTWKIKNNVNFTSKKLHSNNTLDDMHQRQF
ncbi:MAG: hypothetical protein ACXAC2_22805, partial [Candidatus Kariarchaeaceae archaeon]